MQTFFWVCGIASAVIAWVAAIAGATFTLPTGVVAVFLQALADDLGGEDWFPSVAEGAGSFPIGIGGLRLVNGSGPNRRFDFHYDTINGVFETPHGTWLLVTNDQGTVADVAEDPDSHLVLWEEWAA